MVLEHLKKHPDVIKWNKNGQILFKDAVIPDSNIVDLISSVVTNKKLTSVPVMTQSVFLKALSDTNIPETWIKNKQSKKLLHSYKEVKDYDDDDDDDDDDKNRKVKKMEWTSSR